MDTVVIHFDLCSSHGPIPTAFFIATNVESDLKNFKTFH